MSKNLIMSLATGYTVDQIQNFVFSLRKYYNGQICVITDVRTPEFLDFLTKYSIDNFILNEQVHFAQVGLLRWKLTKHVLETQYPDIENIILSDIRDVIFQGNPFDFLSGKSLDFSVELKRIKECGTNTEWIKRIYGEDEFTKIKDQWILCGGVTAGKRHGVIRLCDLIINESTKAASLWYPDFIDQAALNVLYRKGEFPDCHLHRTGDSLISTMGHARSFTLDKEGYLLGDRSQRVAMVHQYDRLELLKSIFNKTLNNQPVIEETRTTAPKKKKIIDSFMLFNELDILEGRLEYLYDKVDYFVIVESTLTHSGSTKPLNYIENINRYSRFQDKILYFPLVINSIDEVKGTDSQNSDSWKIENYQRNQLSRGLSLFESDDIAIISDIDEIPRKEELDNYIKNLSMAPAIGLEQRMQVTNLRPQDGSWVGSVITQCGIAVMVSPQHCRDQRWHMPRMFDAGWHMTYWGGVQQIHHKIKSFAHQEFNVSEINDPDRMLSRIQQGLHPVDGPIIYTDRPTNWPLDLPLKPMPEDFIQVFSKYIV